MTARQLWALKRNFMIFRLRGALSLFSDEDIEILREYLPKDEAPTLYGARDSVEHILNRLIESKWQG